MKHPISLAIFWKLKNLIFIQNQIKYSDKTFKYAITQAFFDISSKKLKFIFLKFYEKNIGLQSFT
jgi:hypothetical protein